MRVPGRVGQSILDVARLHKLPMDGFTNDAAVHQIKQSDVWTEDVFGEGPYSLHSHVLISPEWLDKVPPPLNAESERLDALDDALTAKYVVVPFVTSTSSFFLTQNRLRRPPVRPRHPPPPVHDWARASH